VDRSPWIWQESSEDIWGKIERLKSVDEERDVIHGLGQM